ncbi:Serine/threonine protein kinase [Nonomuraea solani]|uniref:Serine/threonine protein kinase n=1 Tax=Nonomuraea solani TaxID=1144553 RepID=A0A1H6F103_9ACTN|nr:glycoside hydrolase family 6 protein [Nonomuraea solani]SEH03828.1 Serine/threonine protein kinase [Nonomuraea solani]
MAHGTTRGETAINLGGDPSVIGGHRVIRRLGAGGMGVVYLAETRARTPVAIKVIHRHLAADPAFRRRFRREVMTMRRVARFSTAAVIEADLDGDVAYVVTEYVPGPTLFSAVSRRGPMSGSELDGLAMSTAVALRAIHAAGVVHRDLKPGNVLLSPVGPKVIDFGLAFTADSTTLSVTGMGTPAYMAPEQVRGMVSAASDVFAWGGVMVFAAGGRPPFGSGGGHDVLYRVVHEDPVLPAFDGVLAELVGRALSKDPAARPTAAELVDVLGAGATTVRLSAPPARRPYRRWMWAGAALALLTAGAVVTPQTIASRPPQPSPALSPGPSPAQTRPPLPGTNPLLADGVRFYTQPDTEAERQARTWAAQGRTADAALMRALSRVPQAMWLAGGSPADVTRTVREAVTQARRQSAVPVFVTNNIPGRDCWNGGASDTGAYRGWINAVAEGIGDRPAVVALEPSSLARMPGSPECPKGGEAAVQRYADLSYAVDTLTGLARTAVYLDGGVPGWPAFTQMAERLVNANAARADGFYVNAVGYRPTGQSLTYAANLARCVHLKATSCGAKELKAVPDDTPGLPHFIIDTSRNGAGEWRPPPGRFPAPDEWCNPPGRGAGERPATGTGTPLADALLWLNSPGYSNGRCTRGTSGPADPAYGIVTPDAGQWWPDQALERARNAVPPLTP